MTKIQRMIKFFAISLAILLIVSIFNSMINIVSNIFSLGVTNKTNELIIKKITNDIEELDIELKNSKLTFKNDTIFKVETNNNIRIREKNKKLIIEENSFLFNDTNEEIIIYIPNNKNFNKISIEAGSGNIDIENLITKVLDLELGAGKVESKSLNVSSSASIDSGAGSLNINGALINNLDLDMGIGEVIINGTLTGKSEIDAGVGNLEVNLNEFISNYNIQIDKGIGDIYINDDIVNKHYSIGTGPNKIDINGGIGRIVLNTLN